MTFTEILAVEIRSRGTLAGETSERGISIADQILIANQVRSSGIFDEGISIYRWMPTI
jgi:hypothetical protein